MSITTAVPPARREAHEPPEARGLARDAVRMLVASLDAGLTHARARDLPDHLRAGDVLVVNTSATLPAALPARRADDSVLMLHLSTPCGGDAGWVVELRERGERFAGARAGETLALPADARATLLAPYLGGARLWLAQLHTGARPLLDYLGEHGAPIRYGYVERSWPLADYQTVFAIQPGSAEMPSAGRPFTPELVTALVARGIAIVPVTLHTGVSSQEAGELPYPERYAVPAPTARLVNAARAGGGRVVAVGTTVVRALETVAEHDGTIRAGAGRTRHVVTPQTGVRAVDGLLTGWHEPAATHLLMLVAVAGRALVDASYRAAAREGYAWHEFGDLNLILP
ncbi:MAG: S-adenosylmethionine:tRNA ribosyltransferase-isomerase-like protein [uncultured Solirubrobacteraceae bacterium]|uniref:S-adenosylmethionine:tRNA ribosyltransferase-isomerase-like protein n=1 Tax=uncultured Solirubrobacteraceae bacterium TaxID=1162706 RepID=A0A6J4TP20_9ACTN|nr:MAG: S-adenosylmethionine:tRNA ribosyltransferase-isomerase-like protein [uncultured Solirubrobacteraceae bacterium]